MKVPGFTAEASLGPTLGSYCGNVSVGSNLGEGYVGPSDLADFFGIGEKKSTAWAFIKALPGAVADTFASGEAYQSFAQGQQAAVHVLTFGLAGDPEARARQLELEGYKRPEPTVERVSRGIGTYVIGPATQMAVFSWGWGALRLPTYQFAWRPFSWRGWIVGLPGHAYWGAEGTWVHAVGDVFRELLTIEEVSAPSSSSWILSGVPILFPDAVVATGGTAYTCLTAAIMGFLKGWIPW